MNIIESHEANPTYTVEVDRIHVKQAVIRRLQEIGWEYDIADKTAEKMLEAEDQGKYNHGIARLPYYMKAFLENRIDPNGTLDEIMAYGAILILNGNRGLGLLQAEQAMERAMGIATAFNVGVVWLTNSSHIGCAGTFAAQAARQGNIGIVITNGAPALVPPGHDKPLTGTNPIAISIPDGRSGVICADAGAGNVSLGKIEAAVKEGKDIPAAWVSAGTPAGSSGNAAFADALAALTDRSLAYRGSDAQSQNASMALTVLWDLVLAQPAGGRLSLEQQIGEATSLFIAIRLPEMADRQSAPAVDRLLDLSDEPVRLPGAAYNRLAKLGRITLDRQIWCGLFN